ncbi:glycosaminoglycan attachment site [Methylophilus sp. 13]|uniref:glycosaminoglycan attachment site n=1 Tax=Methylophilus sp. 13 TaxID=2781018 RepID=UPI0018900F03|nr:glycosaminoglycan attachment site [Methylophilus sp. 13]MBF5037952.1 glycosaminoglycan attachment site [Methylophilus sp. 13]
MATLPLFKTVAEAYKLHPIYKKLLGESFEPERALLLEWSEGMVDRDGKFCHEFQLSFESSMWELYLHACLKKLGAEIDFSHHAPDFVVNGKEGFNIEATISAPAKGGQGPIGFDISDMPKGFNEFNSEATIRVCNSFISKVTKFRNNYSKLSHAQNKPFVLAIALFHAPFSHFAAMRPIISALYGLYHDEDETIASGATKMVSYNVAGVFKKENVFLPLGYFCTPEYSDISAVIYSDVATWGKIRAMANNPDAMSFYTTFHPNPNGLEPIVKNASKAEYNEDLLDGLCIFHNPYAKHPLSPRIFDHERIAQAHIKPDGELYFDHPDDFLFCRMINTITPKTSS